MLGSFSFISENGRCVIAVFTRQCEFVAFADRGLIETVPPIFNKAGRRAAITAHAIEIITNFVTVDDAIPTVCKQTVLSAGIGRGVTVKDVRVCI